MKADADAAADEDEESDDEEEAMDLSEVQEKLESCSEKELKKMLKDMELPIAGKVGAPAPSIPASAPAWPRQCSHSTSRIPPQPQPHMPT